VKELRLLKALGQVAPKYPEEAMSSPPRRRWKRLFALAACLALVVGLSGTVIDRLGLFRAGCSAWPGDFIDGQYYFNAGHGSLYCWDGETTEKVLGALQSDGWLVNEYGVYFKRGRRLFVKPHTTGKSQKLYTAPLFDRSHIGFSFYGDDVVVRIYNKWKEYASEVLVDGVTGAVLGTVTDKLPYGALYDNMAWSDTHLAVGERQLVLVPLAENRFDLTENGKSILPEGADHVSAYYYRHNDQVLFSVSEEWPDRSTVFLVRPDGDDRLVEMPCYNCDGVAGDFLYYIKNEEQEVWCQDTRTGETWQLENDTEMEFYSLATDGVHLVTCVPWAEYQALWQIVYNEAGHPEKLILLDEDIQK